MLRPDSTYFGTRDVSSYCRGDKNILPIVCVALGRVTSNDSASGGVVFNDMESAAYMRRENPRQNIKAEYVRTVGADMVCHGLVRMRDGDVS